MLMHFSLRDVQPGRFRDDLEIDTSLAAWVSFNDSLLLYKKHSKCPCISINNFVEIRVGSHHYTQIWHVVCREVMRISFFFGSALSLHHLFESGTRVVSLLDADPEVFSVFVEWFNNNPIRYQLTVHGKGYNNLLLIRACVLGEMSDFPRFKNYILKVLDQTNLGS